MPRSGFSGPAYGAKCLLALAHRASVAASSVDLELLQVDIPTGEQWFVTDVHAHCSNQGNGGTVQVRDNATSILNGGTALTLVTNDAAEQVITPAAGEDEGKRVVGPLRVTASDGITTAIADLTVSVYGFIRNVRAPR